MPWRADIPPVSIAAFTLAALPLLNTRFLPTRYLAQGKQPGQIVVGNTRHRHPQVFSYSEVVAYPATPGRFLTGWSVLTTTAPTYTRYLVHIPAHELAAALDEAERRAPKPTSRIVTTTNPNTNQEPPADVNHTHP